MSDSMTKALAAAGAGMAAQSMRMRVVSENIANANATTNSPDADPYRRKVMTFNNIYDEATETTLIRSDDAANDPRPFRTQYEPGHPAANANGYVKYPNVDVMIELADMREANRSYLANMQIVKQTREAINATLDLLRT